MKATAYQKQYGNQVFYTILVIVLTVFTICSSSAQIRPRLTEIKYKGFEVSFGNRAFQVSSDIEKINGMQAGHDGGTLGLVLGNDLLITRIKVAGYFYSNNNTPRTQELFETALQANVYPMELLKNKRARLRPYLTTGFSLDNVKFYGFYVGQIDSDKGGYEPLLGKISQISAMGGLGFEYALSRQCDFINLFAEINTSIPLSVNASTEVFNSTTMSKSTSVNIGVSFGLNGNKKFNSTSR